jgi:hypothetical protein
MSRLVTMLSGLWPGEPLRNVDAFQDDDVFFTSDTVGEVEMQRAFSFKGNPGYVVNDHYAFTTVPSVPGLYTCFLHLAWRLPEFKIVEFPNNVTTLTAANFTVNKKHVHRHFLIKAVEWFNLDVDYSYSGLGRTFDFAPYLSILAESSIPQEFKEFLLSPVKIETRWFNDNKDLAGPAGYEIDGDLVSKWLIGLDQIYCNSAVSLIGEAYNSTSDINQVSATFTEKTMYAMTGLTFPLWIGGYKQAQAISEYGFDVFDDVINHDYQHHDNVFDRCWQALILNIDLLSDKEKLNELRQQNLSRLIANRELLKGNHVLTQCINRMQSWPAPVQNALEPVINQIKTRLAQPPQRYQI